MTEKAQNNGLRIIFSIFLGLMLTVLIGIGVYTFHSPPEQMKNEIREYRRQEQAIRNSKPDIELTAEDREQIQHIVQKRNELIDTAQKARKKWALQTSIILIVFATLTMIMSLIRAEKAAVINNGLLLGGVFSMLYGVGWIATSDTSITRFVVMTIAVLIALGLGYVRFVHHSKVSAAPTNEPSPGNADLAELDRRVKTLEQQLEKAAQAFTGNNEDSD